MSDSITVISLFYFMMATTILKNDKVLGTSRLTGKFIARPVVVVKPRVYNGPSAEGAREYNSLKREFSSLFSGFGRKSLRQLDAFDRVLKKAAQLRSEVRRVKANKIVTPGKSWAQVVLKGPHNEKPLVRTMVKKVSETPWSRAHARRDYTLAFKRMEKERAAARLIVEGMASRRPRKVFPKQREHVKLVDRASLKEALRQLRRERKEISKPKEVSTFDFRCYQSVETTTEIVNRVQEPCYFTWGQKNTSVKQVKIRQTKYQFDENCQEKRFEFKPTKLERRDILISQLARTSLGKILMSAILKRQAELKGECLEDITRVMSLESERIEPQGDTAPVTSLEIPTPSSSYGLKIFGERTPDLKSLCRRTIHLGTVQAQTCTKGNPRDCPPTAQIKLTPLRHVTPLTSSSYDNRWRNGNITVVGSQYRLWRGSLRFRFVVVGNPPEGTTIYVQHRYDLITKEKEIISPGPKKVFTRDDIMNTQYATFGQPLDVNSTCSIEVPYYSEKEGLSTLPSGQNQNNSNGVLLIWIHSKVESNIHLEVFYELGDDNRFSVYQGSPASIDLNEINPEPQMDLTPIEPQMDPEGVVGTVSKTETKQSNTVIDNLNPVDIGQNHSFTDGFKKLAISREIQSFSTLVDRWILLGDVTWTSSETHNQRLKLPFNNDATSFNIPGDIIRKNKDSPNAQLFLTHRWSRFTTRLRFCLNSNPFQVGCCVPSVLYKTIGEDSSVWDNLYSAMQRNHCKLNAGSSNDAELIIPYHHINTMICLKELENIAQVSITVLNPLVATETVAKQCSITVYACFEDTEFSGMISRGLGEENVKPEMDSIANLMNAGSNLIRTINMDANRDKPPLSLQPVSFIPQGMPTFAYMDGVPAPVNMLRADSQGQTPHPVADDEMNPYWVSSKWGYLQTVNWTTSQKYGDEIVSCEVVPLMSFDKYNTTVLAKNISARVYPPVAYVSSMFGKWRGDLEFKFEIFASKFHTGRMIIGCVPFPGTSTITIENLKYSAYKIFDLCDSTEFIFRAPWHWRNACASMYMKGVYDIPSKLFAKVINPLIAIDSVPNSIYVNIYIRAAPNFEVMIPRPSILAPSFVDKIVPPDSEYLKLYNFENKIWSDWRGVLPRKDGYAMTMNIDSVANGWEGFLNAKLGEVYKLGDRTTKGYYIRAFFNGINAEGKDSLYYARWAVYDPALSTANAHGLVLCVNEANARKFALEAMKSNPDWVQMREDYCLKWYKQSRVSQISSDNKIWTDATNEAGDSPIWLVYNVVVSHQDEFEFEVIQPQQDTEDEVIEAQGLFETIRQSVSAPRKVAEMADSVKNTADSLTEKLNKITKMTDEFSKSEKKLQSSSFKEKIRNYATDKILEKVGSEISEVSSKYFEIITHIIYAIMSPTKKIVGWALFNIYKKIFGMTFDGISLFTKYVGDLWDNVKCSTQRPQEEKIKPQSDGTIGSYASLLFTSIATFCKLKVSPPSSWKGISDGLFAFSNAARSGSYVSQFIKDNIELFRRIYDKFLSLFGVTSSNYKLIAGLQDDRLKDWLTQSDIILSAQYQEKLITDPSWSQKAFELAVVGRVLERTMSEDSVTPSRLLQYVRANVAGLKKIENKLISRKVFSGARYTPSCIWIGGQAGTGKTFFMQELASELAKFHKYTGGQLYHTMTAGVKYFDAYDGQPMIVLDDFLAGPIAGTSELGVQFLQLKSCNAFNMPKSAVEDKDQLLNFTDLGITSNQLFVENCPGVHDNEAYNRRRDVVLEFKFVPQKDGEVVTPDNLKQLFTREELSRMEHLTACYVKDPTNPRSIKIAIDRGNSLKQSILTHVLTELKEYHRVETLNYQDRCKAVLDVLEQAPCEGSFETVFKKYSFAIEKFNKMSLSGSETFSHWLKDTIAASTSKVVPEMDTEPDNPFVWPTVMTDRCDSKDRDGLLEPFRRDNMPPFKPKGEHLCLHDKFDFEFANYDEIGVFFSDRYLITEEVSELALSVPAGPCRIRSNAGLDVCSNCAWLDPVRKTHFLNKYIFSPCIKGDLMQKVDIAKATLDWSVLDDEPPEVVSHLKKIFTVNAKTSENVKLLLTIEEEQKKLQKKFEQVGNVVIPKKPKWKTFCSTVWNILLDVLLALHALIGILVGAFLVCSFVSYLANPVPNPEIHPSGDFKTLRNSKTVKARSIRLLDGEGAEISTENDIIDSCAYKRNNGGIYRKIINNSFFLIGKVPLPDDKFVIYKARCLGLYNKKFICLEHYITYFKNMGVKTVAVIYHEAKGMVEYELDEIKFSWSSEGYGVGELPKSAPKQFANICKFMPSESFDMTYPRKLKIFEIWNDNVVEHLVEAELLTAPVQVTGTAAEGSWKISQGFKYAWGGKGCCGSVVIAEEMACPLVAIHTAGVQGKKGYAELLFRETFDTPDFVLEYVTPNMETSDSVYGLEGFYYQVGQLDPDMAVRGSTSTRIEPSEIQGVFPVLTEPAPLTSKDERLESPKDILKIGASKRCDPPKEFPPLDVNTAFLSYWNLVRTEVKPVRANPGVLTMTQAIEGLPLPGYDPVEMSTSEGYPWVNMRPKGFSNKSWMFQRDQYPDGRLKITGVDPDLKRVFDLKEIMRSRGVVPSSYFTCCLKDARILKEKIPTPGKTRVFEACPIDLTIAYRQYNLDFTAALSAARLRAENSIGINPDGPEWTDLANWLLDFSDKIITADYSAFGPRLNHAVLENAFNITTEWYELFEECDEEEKQRRYITREVLREEIVHAPTVAKDLVFVPTCGMPSGFPDTVTKNTQSNCQYIRLAFLHLARKHMPCYSDLYWFTKLVRLVTNGDDLIAAVKDEIIEWFNNETIIEFFALYRIKMTDALKSGKVRPYCSLEEATYLKRGFMKHPKRRGQWLAPLEQSSITDTANWVWRSVDKRGASLVNSEMCCRLAYTKGPEFYEQVCKTIATRWNQEGVNFIYPPWKLLDNHVWDNAPGPTFSF